MLTGNKRGFMMEKDCITGYLISILLLFWINAPAFAGTLGTESPDFGNPGPTFTVSSAGAHTVTGALGPTPTDGQDTFNVTIPSTQVLTSVSYSGVTLDGNGQPLNFSLWGCGLSGVTNFNQTLPAGTTNCTLQYYINTNFQTSAGAWTVTVNTIDPPTYAPTDIALSSYSVGTSGGLNAVVGIFSTTDQNAGDTHTYTLVSGTGSADNNLFNISLDTLRANDASTMAVGSYSIRVRTTDQGGLYYEKQMTISVSAYTPITGGHLGDNAYSKITNVTFGAINNNSDSPADSTYYSDYTAQSTTVTQGIGYPISVSINGSDTSNSYLKVYIDWNQNGSFADTGEGTVIINDTGAGTTPTNPYTAAVNVPAGASLGSTRMRVMNDYKREPLADGNIDYGEAEDYTLNVISANIIPTFVGATITLTVNQNAGATDIKSLLHVSDTDSSQTETWTQIVAPNHGGTLSFSGATASSGSADITPGGIITYTPANGYSGTETFTVQVSDSVSSTTRTITVTIVPPPTVTDARISISGATGTAGAFRIGDTVTAAWNNTAGGDSNAGITGVTVDGSAFGCGAAVSASNSGGTWTATCAIVSGATDATNRNVSVTATNSAGSTTTADTTNATVDNIAPTVTDARISISGATGTGGAFRIGDTVTAAWNNTAGGDNNADTINSVTVDFSQFGGGAAVAATNSSGTWTASYIIVAGGIDAANRNVSVTATDNAGNSTTAADTTNVTVDNIAPTVTDAGISISGATGTGGAFRIGDTVTAAWNNTAGGDNNADTISSVTVDFSQFGGGATVAATNSSGTWTASYPIVAGSIDSTNRNVSVTATDNAGNSTTTADTTNATVDNIAPTVTDARISISGATGTGGAFRIGDTVTAAWNNTAGGDNNADTISSVTVDFSQFGGGAAVAATNSSGTWTASYPIVAGSIDAINRNVSVTATDNAGNSTTTADTTNATVDNIALAVTSVSVPLNGTYVAGQHLDFTVNFSEAVIVNTGGGTPYMQLTLDTGGTVNAPCISGSGSSALMFRYTVINGNEDMTGITVGGSINANGGTLRDAAGNNAVLTLNSVGSTAGVFVDAIAPAISISAPSAASTITGPMSYTVTYSDTSFNTSSLASGDITLNKTGTADATTINIAGSGNTRTVTISDITGTGTISISISAGTASDTAGNTAPAAGPGTSFMVMPTVLYVSEGGLTGGLCDTWANACDLQYALGLAPSGVELWVQAGTYTPTTGADRTATFRLKSDVALYGGFIGTETARSARDFAANLTTLSGDIGAAGVNTDNSYHVLDASYTANTAILDGFTVTGGNASAGTFGNNSGGAIFIYEGSPALSNVTFSNNTASNGGALYIDTCSPILTNITFSGNTAANYGGGIYNWDLGNPTLTNVTFSGNAAAFGGGIYNDFNSSPTLTNVTFSGNTASSSGGGMYNASSSNPILKNSILWGNPASDNSQIYNDFTSVPAVTYSIIQGGCPAGSTCSNLITSDPLLDPSGLQNNGGSMRTIAILSGSSAINAGDNSSCPPADQRGISRPQGTNCDIGAYEFMTATTMTLGSSPNPSVYGESITFTATVTDSEAGSVPTGVVTFMDSGTPIGSGTLDGTAQAVFSMTSLTAGSHEITAVYGGDTNFGTSASAPVTQTVTQASTVTTITGNTPNTSVMGQVVTVTYTVGALGGMPTGNVTVSDGANTCTATVAAGACTITFATLGTKTLTATYAGDANFIGSTSAGTQQTVNQAGTTTTITAHPPEPSALGQTVTVAYTVTVVAPASGTPTGNITVSDGVNNCTATVAAGSCSLSLTTSGSRTLTATYAGDANFIGSSGTASHTVSFQYLLNVSTSGTGTVTGNRTGVEGNGISCGADCSETFIGGTVVALSATEASGWKFSGWSGNPDCADGQVTVNGPLNCVATFELNNSVTIPAATGNGDITLATNSPGCGFTAWGAKTEAQVGNDTAYVHPYGLVEFTLNCAAADVTITYPGSIVYYFQLTSFSVKYVL